MANKYGSQQGFSLFELVLGIALLGILMAGAVAMLINLAPKTVDPAMEVRAAQLAQRLLNDISLQKYDHNNTHLSCGLAGGDACTLEADYGPDVAELALADFNDVDDYHTAAICDNTSINAPCSDGWIDACWFTEQCADDNNAYRQFKVNIVVKPHALDSEPNSAKLIEISVRLPKGSEWHYAVLRGNYP